MSNMTIDQYTQVISLGGNEFLLISQDGVYKKVTLDQIRNLATDISNTELAALAGKAASAQDVKNILNTINSSLNENTQNINNYGKFGLSANLSVASSGSTSTVPLDTVIKENTELYSLNNNLIKVLKKGTYEIEAQIDWASSSEGDRLIRINASDESFTNTQKATGSSWSSTLYLKCSATLNENATIELRQGQSCGSALNINANTSFVKIRKIA